MLNVTNVYKCLYYYYYYYYYYEQQYFRFPFLTHRAVFHIQT